MAVVGDMGTRSKLNECWSSIRGVSRVCKSGVMGRLWGMIPTLLERLLTMAFKDGTNAFMSSVEKLFMSGYRKCGVAFRSCDMPTFVRHVMSSGGIITFWTGREDNVA